MLGPEPPTHSAADCVNINNTNTDLYELNEQGDSPANSSSGKNKL